MRSGGHAACAARPEHARVSALSPPCDPLPVFSGTSVCNQSRAVNVASECSSGCRAPRPPRPRWGLVLARGADAAGPARARAPFLAPGASVLLPGCQSRSRSVEGELQRGAGASPLGLAGLSGPFPGALFATVQAEPEPELQGLEVGGPPARPHLCDTDLNAAVSS